MNSESESHGGPGSRATRRKRGWTAAASLTGSVAIHIGLVAAAATVVWQVGVSRPQHGTGRELFITFDAPGDGREARAPEPIDSAQTRPEAKAAAEQASSDRIVASEAPRATDAPAASKPLTGLTSGQRAAQAPDRIASGTSGERADPTIAPDDLPASMTPEITFAGMGAGGVRSVVYVVDCSGPMVTSLPRVTAELQRSIGRLSPSQKFAVVLFSRTDGDSDPVEMFSPVLVRATVQAKKLAAEWVARAQPRGASNPLAGLEAALALKPDAVFLLSRSIERSGGGVWELGREETLRRLEHLNPADATTGRRPVLIQTIQFLDEDPTGAMQAIGTIHGRSAPMASAEGRPAVGTDPGRTGGAGYTVIRRSEDLSKR